MASSITVIIPNWNGGPMTADCVRSLQANSGVHLEIIVVDNGSSDGSVEILRREFPMITVLSQPRNLGFAAACNIGIRHALAGTAEYLLLLNNDTFAATDFIVEMLRVIEADPRIAAVCPKIYFALTPQIIWYAGGDFSLWTANPKHRGWKQLDRGQFDCPREITQATGCAMLVRSCAVQEVGLLEEQFWAYVEDLEWSVRFRKKGYRLAFAPKSRLWHYDGATAVSSLRAGSQSLRQFLSTRNMIFLARKHLRWWQTPSFVFGFFLHHLLFFTAVRLWRHDFRAVGAIYRGLVQGLRTPLAPRVARIGKKEQLTKVGAPTTT